MKTYHHLQRLSLSYYDSHQVGALLSTITSDVGTIQSFASSSTLGILVDLMKTEITEPFEAGDCGPLADVWLFPRLLRMAP